MSLEVELVQRLLLLPGRVHGQARTACGWLAEGRHPLLHMAHFCAISFLLVREGFRVC
jgi:hypothetical protein